MTGLLLKDFYTLRKTVKQMLGTLLLLSVWSAFLKNSSFIAMISLMYGAMLLINSMASDEVSGFTSYMLTLPVTKKEMVREKYLLLCIMLTAGFLVGIAGDLGIRFLLRDTAEFGEDILFLALMACYLLLVFSFMLPAMIKLGVEKARLFLIVIYVGVFGIFGGFFYLAKDLGFNPSKTQLGMILVIFALFTIIGMMISYFISLRIMEKKEW